MTREDGTILAEELGPVAEACGQTPEQVRSCLRRLVNEGLFVREGTGPSARFRATPRGVEALGWTLERTRLAYAQDAAGKGWDRHWRLVAFAVPERRRSARDAFRDRLVALGGAALQGGLYVSPHPWLDDVSAAAKRLQLDDAVSFVTTDDLVVAGERDPRRLVQRLWPVDELGARYTAFVERWKGVPETLAEVKRRRERVPDTAFLPHALEMAVEFQRVFFVDPLLPPELLPRPWPGRTARDLLVRSRRLALAVRESPGARALFRLYDDAVEALP
jgi:phenylacetic acid degradation operon negative regulatory protein